MKTKVLKKKPSFFVRLVYAVDYLLHLNFNTPWSKLNDEMAKLELVAANMKEGVIMLDKRGDVIFVNNVAKSIIRSSKDEGSSNIRGKFEKTFKVEIEKSLGKATSANPLIMPEVEANGGIYQLMFARVKECEEGNCRAYAMIWIQDLTETKTLERRKSEFVSVVAHQLRTPLSGLKWTLHMLINGDFGDLTNEQKVFVMKSYENNERMISLVNDMLAADRIESGRVKLERMKINLRDLVENVLFEVLPNAQKKNIKIDFKNNADDKFIVLADSTKVRAVIQNLLENSIKYTMKDGLVTIGIEKHGDEYQFSIKDNGIGIPEDQKDQIFTRFFRASNAIKIETSGTGLGLYMVRKIIEIHGGKVWLNSAENKGTEVYFTLPAYND
jgi:two-component system sensor histidine kinase VicK